MRHPAVGWLADFLLPGGCVVCRRWIPDRSGSPSLVCGRCRSRLAPATWPRCPRCHHPRGTGRSDSVDCLECRDWPEALTIARYAWVLTSPASELVHALKYEGWRELAPLMGAAMARVAREAVPADREHGIVVPMPTTAERLRGRGYNQATLLARSVARGLERPIVEALARTGAVASQTSLTPAERRENVRGAFRSVATAARRLDGAHVILVDDVLTTGATAAEAATTLAGEGARSVSLVTFARALPRVTVRRAA